MTEVVVTAAVNLVWLVVMFVPLERAFSARPQRVLRKDFATDLLFFFGQYLLFATAAVFLIDWAVAPLDDWSATAGLRAWFGDLHIAVQVVAIVMLGDLVAYWGHRLQHRVDFLWRFHSVHHTSTEIDWLAAHREHPIDGLYTQGLVNLPALLLGFSLAPVLGVVAFRSMWAIFIHSNVRIPLGPLQYFVGSPKLHRWHHAKSRDVGNYANLAPWLDVLFGTYHCPENDPDELGVEEPMPADYLGLLSQPFRRRPIDPPEIAAHR